jgi:hypothetical protein
MAHLLRVGALASALVALLPATTSAAHRVCPTQHTLLRTKTGVVFSRSQHARKVYYGCLWRVRRTYRLQQVGEYGLNNIREPRSVHLAGRYVAYPQDYGTIDEEVNTVSVRDLVTGKVIYQDDLASTGSGNVISALVLKLNGSVAWTTRTEDAAGNATVEVLAMDSPGHARVLANDPMIDPVSLQLSADRKTIDWLRDGAMQNAPLN